MKRRGFLITGGIVVAAALIAMLVFVFSGNRAEDPTPIDLDGTWKVAVYTSDGNITIIENEYMVFHENVASDYRDGGSSPYAASKYTLENNELELPDISRKYTVDQKSGNYIRLHEKQGVYLDLIRYKNEDMSPVDVRADLLSGKWDIVYRNASQSYAGDYLLFEDNGTVSQYKAGSSEAASSAEYEQSNGHLLVNAWGKDMVIYPVADDVIMLLELANDNGFIWELKKAD